METAVASGKKTSVPVSPLRVIGKKDRRDPWFNSSAVQKKLYQSFYWRSFHCLLLNLFHLTKLLFPGRSWASAACCTEWHYGITGFWASDVNCKWLMVLPLTTLDNLTLKSLTIEATAKLNVESSFCLPKINLAIFPPLTSNQLVISVFLCGKLKASLCHWDLRETFYVYVTFYVYSVCWNMKSHCAIELGL